jgi:hypothetical protein
MGIEVRIGVGRKWREGGRGLATDHLGDRAIRMTAYLTIKFVPCGNWSSDVCLAMNEIVCRRT